MKDTQTPRLSLTELRPRRSSEETDLEINSTVFRLAVCAVCLAAGFVLGQWLA